MVEKELYSSLSVSTCSLSLNIRETKAVTLFSPFVMGGKESIPAARAGPFLPHQRSEKRPRAKEVLWSGLQSVFTWLRPSIGPPGGLQPELNQRRRRMLSPSVSTSTNDPVRWDSHVPLLSLLLLCVWLDSTHIGNHPLQKISSPFSSHRAHPGSPALTHILHAVASLQGSLEKDGNDSLPVKDGQSCPFHIPFKCEGSTQAALD